MPIKGNEIVGCVYIKGKFHFFSTWSLFTPALMSRRVLIFYIFSIAPGRSELTSKTTETRPHLVARTQFISMGQLDPPQNTSNKLIMQEKSFLGRYLEVCPAAALKCIRFLPRWSLKPDLCHCVCVYADEGYAVTQEAPAKRRPAPPRIKITPRGDTVGYGCRLSVDLTQQHRLGLTPDRSHCKKLKSHHCFRCQQRGEERPCLKKTNFPFKALLSSCVRWVAQREGEEWES